MTQGSTEPADGAAFWRAWRRPVLLAAGLLLAGCAYDPSTGSYVPCCAAPSYAYGAPNGYAAPYPAALPHPQPGYVQPDYAQPGYGQPGYGQPGYTQPGYTQPGAYAPSPEAVPQAYAQPQANAVPDAAPYPGLRGPGPLARRFASANTTGDGMLTYQQAQQAHWAVVVRNFGAIDTGRRGYVTLADIRSWMAARRGAQAQQSG